MQSPLLVLFSNIYFWLFIVSLIGGFLSLRLANSNRDQAAFADFPDKPEKYIFRSRLFYGLSFVFFIAMLIGIVIFSFRFLQSNRPSFSLDLSRIASAINITPAPTDAIVTEESLPTDDEPTTTEPKPTPIEVATQAATASAPGQIAVAFIGNTNFQGVNVREQPSLDGEILAKLINRTEVYVFDQPTADADGYIWRKVRLEDGVLGWIAEPFLIFDGDSNQ